MFSPTLSMVALLALVAVSFGAPIEPAESPTDTTKTSPPGGSTTLASPKKPDGRANDGNKPAGLGKPKPEDPVPHKDTKTTTLPPPQVPSTTAKAKVPVVPDNKKVPDNKEVPGNKEVPDNKEVPGNKKVPDNKEVPDNKKVPGKGDNTDHQPHRETTVPVDAQSTTLIPEKATASPQSGKPNAASSTLLSSYFVLVPLAVTALMQL